MMRVIINIRQLDIRFWTCVFLILLVSFLAHSYPRREGKAPKLQPPDLPIILNGWHGVDLEIESDALNLIKPDFYIYRNYRHGRRVINVFVGYYENLKKSDLIHSPLVCYPGQGWVISEKSRIGIETDTRTMDFACMKVIKGKTENIVLYAYRAVELVTGSAIKARIHLIKEMLFHNVNNAGFIRFSTEILGGDMDESKNSIINFIKENHIQFLGSNDY